MVESTMLCADGDFCKDGNPAAFSCQRPRLQLCMASFYCGVESVRIPYRLQITEFQSPCACEEAAGLTVRGNLQAIAGVILAHRNEADAAKSLSKGHVPIQAHKD